MLSLSGRPKVAYLHFEGIVNIATVRVNGVEVGKLVALTDSSLDVAAALNYNGANQLDVVIDDRLMLDTVPGGNTEIFIPQYGALAYALPIAWVWDPGIVRNVSLVISDHAVATDVFAQTTLNDGLSLANIKVRVRVAGDLAQNLSVAVSLTSSGVLMGTCTGAPAATNELSCNVSVSSPVLWSPETPNLYDLLVNLSDASGVADRVVDRIGLRKLEVRGNRIYLNNKAVFLRGISRHDLYGISELVADESIIDWDLRTLKSLDANFIRTIHYPPDARFAKRADEIGMLISEEIPAWAELASPAVAQIAQGMLQSMIERDMNRASVILWFTGSGDMSGASYFPGAAAKAKSVDPERLVSFVFDDGAMQTDQIQQNANAMRAAGMNVYAQNGYWSASTVQTLMPAMPSDMPTLLTEWTGGEGSNRGPLGPPGVELFPSYISPDGNSTEERSAQLMEENFNGFSSYACSPTRGSPCLSGSVYYNWQDIEWPGIEFFYPKHIPIVRVGLVYEDRTWKAWPTAVFYKLMQQLPH